MAQALALGEQNKEVIRADKLQKLHTLHNLAQLLKGGVEGLPGVARTLRDSSLEAEAQSLRDGYLAESVAKLAVADQEYQESLRAMNSAAHDDQHSGLITMCLDSFMLHKSARHSDPISLYNDAVRVA